MAAVSGVYNDAKWKAKRDEKGKGPGKGAVSGVSMGDELRKYHEEWAKGPEAAMAQGKKLAAAIAKYKKAVEKKYPDFTKATIEKQLEGFLKTDMDSCKKALEAVVIFETSLKVAKNLWTSIKKRIGEAKTKGQTFDNKDLASLGSAMEKAGANLQRADLWKDQRKDEATALKALGYQLTAMKGKEGEFKLGAEFAQKIEAALK